MTSKAENMHIYGDDGFYDRISGVSKVYGHAYAARVTDENDTLFISADTLMSVESDDPKKKRLLAYHNVRIFKSDLQGRADSLVYHAADSMLFFYRDPVLWADENQMTADSISILLKNKQISRIYMVANSFVASQDSLKNFNQIKGRKMTAYFQGKNIHHVYVEGNGESLYFALQEKDKVPDKNSGKTDSLGTKNLLPPKDSVRVKVDSTVARNDTTKIKTEKITVVSGMNRILCSNMKINFKEGKVNNISFYIKPDATFIPPHELKREDILLKGFLWRGTDRPTRKQVAEKSP